MRKTQLIFTICMGAGLLLAAANFTREAKMSAEAYANNYADWALQHYKENGQSQLSVMLPSVFVYDASGKAVYYGQNVKNDVPVLESLPKTGLRASSFQPRLSEMLDMVPDLKKDKPSLYASGRQTVVSLTSAGSHCPKCAVQDAAIAKLKVRSDLNVIEIRLQ